MSAKGTRGRSNEYDLKGWGCRTLNFGFQVVCNRLARMAGGAREVARDREGSNNSSPKANFSLSLNLIS